MSQQQHSGKTVIEQYAAVIGAGAAGLVAARELRAEGHRVTVFESGSGLGGVWRYDPRTESEDPLGQDPKRPRVHSSMYQQLRTNLPRDVMAFSDYPFDPSVMGTRSTDPRLFCSHNEVQAYLESFADFYDLHPMLHYNSAITAISPIITRHHNTQPHPTSSHAPIHPDSSNSSSAAIHPDSSTSSSSSAASAATAVSEASSHGGNSLDQDLRPGLSSSPEQEMTYDAVVVCNGHYAEPNLPSVGGMDVYPGIQTHSHNYRENSSYKGKVVLLVGASNSGEDISREISQVADRVILSARTWTDAQQLGPQSQPYGDRSNIYRYPNVSGLTSDGRAHFQGYSTPESVDAVVYCTGYRYRFPFMDQCGIVATHDGHMELQAKLVARVLSGRAALPSEREMMTDAQGQIDELKAAGLPPKQLHMQNMAQFEYNDSLAALCGPDVPTTPAWRVDMYRETGVLKRASPDHYRDDYAGHSRILAVK
ncbi:MAG: hypothetical protein WDW36_007814 [Sanguina aurantia]